LTLLSTSSKISAIRLNLDTIAKEKKMTNKKVLVVMLALVLAFGMSVVGCGGGDNDPYNQPITGVPGTPINVSASALSSSSIQITWSAPSYGNVSWYNIWRSSSAYGTYTQIDYVSGSVRSYTNTGLSSSTTYYYMVDAENSAGRSSQSSYTYATTNSSISVPGTPTDVSASALSSNSIQISWNAPSYGTVTYYNIWRSSSAYGTYTEIGYVSGSTRTYTNTGLSSSTTYYYKVDAQNSAGRSAQSSYTSATTNSSGSSSVIDLTYNTWYPNTLSAGAVHYYRFYANSGYDWYVQWEDRDNSSYTADIKVGVRREGSSTYTVAVTDNSNRISFYVSTAGYYIVEVHGYYSTSYGTYRIGYY
jgi:hypothetical protein